VSKHHHCRYAKPPVFVASATTAASFHGRKHSQISSSPWFGWGSSQDASFFGISAAMRHADIQRRARRCGLYATTAD